MTGKGCTELKEFFNFQWNRNRVEPLLYSNYYELKPRPPAFSLGEELKFRCITKIGERGFLKPPVQRE